MPSHEAGALSSPEQATVRDKMWLWGLDAEAHNDSWGKSAFVAYQASARGGVVRVRVVKDRAVLGGRAVTVSRGDLLG
jgi:hypothetical protein